MCGDNLSVTEGSSGESLATQQKQAQALLAKETSFTSQPLYYDHLSLDNALGELSNSP